MFCALPAGTGNDRTYQSLQPLLFNNLVDNGSICIATTILVFVTFATLLNKSVCKRKQWKEKGLKKVSVIDRNVDKPKQTRKPIITHRYTTSGAF